MAEIIQERIEDRLPELQQLERIGLFSRAEIKAIIKKASDLEYRIQRRTLFKEDFINYVQYEINLLELIQRRRVDDVQLWLSYVVFCKKWATKVQLSKVFSAMLAIHSNKPALWIMAAKWEMEDRLSSESARQLFLRALRFHPECPKLYQEYFRMELMHAEKLRKEKQEFEKAKMDVGNLEYAEEILMGELARIIYKNSVNIIKSAEFHVSLLSIAQLFDFAKDLQREIYDDLQALHTDDPLTWDYVARRELEIESQPGEEPPTTKQTKVAEVGRREERCCAVYEEAVKTLRTEAMCKCYINFCMERFAKKTSSRHLREKRLERTMVAFRKAHDLKLLSEFQYKQWSELLLHHDFLTEALEVAGAGMELFRGSVTMWQVKLQVLIASKSPDVAMLFEEAFVHLKPQICLPLWISWAEWSEGAKSQEDTEAVFKKAVLAVTGGDSVTLKDKYLDWAYRSGGYKKARAVFKSLQESRPFSVDFFRKMIQFEKEQESCKMANLREYYERALREFGSVDSDLWMDYIKEELNHPLGRPEHCGQIYWRAMKMLQGESAELFVAKHAVHQAGQL
ncbi:U3 small nucleolar RNA-associated protein 6 homolog isoform X2 [Neophocaena asiaeorientalis asiaeorientalis]|uniref:U3 small nucleolar RNA-associated protein 6 homolog isoform X2 n=2 Tax=Phocoenidae TaxID=9740 RepID=A0A341AR01_NEOAA|nr:U3 small nucleolar RNA-associated protein 6 homolog isoform X2 [Neophocaena asiaeorientalis asiaeorientalis]XP_032473033.1 U3 small nucleolar RNA-associated protein 6 homolog isoform X4 [Phocoena sinus]